MQNSLLLVELEPQTTYQTLFQSFEWVVTYTVISGCHHEQGAEGINLLL